MARDRRALGTRTSAFASPGRISHDSTAFYASRPYDGMAKEEALAFGEQSLPPQALNNIFCKSSERYETNEEYVKLAEKRIKQFCWDSCLEEPAW